MTFSTLASPGVSLQGGGGSGGGGGTPGGSDTQIQYNSSGTFAGASGLTTNGTELTIASGTKTADAPVLNMSQTWNNNAVTFTGLKFNAEGSSGTNSAAASLLMDLQVGGASKFSVAQNGGITASGSSVQIGMLGNVGLDLGNNLFSIRMGGGLDTILTRRAAANLRFGSADAAAPVAQTLSVQSVVAGTTNKAGEPLTITGSQGTGTGAGGSIIFQVAPAGSSGTAQNALADALTISSTRLATFTAGIAISNSAFQSGGVSFTGSTANFYSRSAGVLDFAAGNTLLFEINGSSKITMSSDVVFGWASTAGATGASGATDLTLFRDAANTLALRNGANAQTFRVYSTYTDASNYERGALNAGADYIELAAETAGTGDDDLDVRLTPAGAGNVRYGTHSAIAAETVTGYITIKDAGGTLRKLAVVS